MQIFVRILVLRMAESTWFYMHISNLSRVSGLFVYTDGQNLHETACELNSSPLQIYMYHIVPLSRASAHGHL